MKRDIEPGPVLGRLDAGREEIRVEVRYVAGLPFVDVRRWGRNDRGLYPTVRGLLVPNDLIPDLIASLVHAFSHGRLYAASAVESDPSPSPSPGPAPAPRRASPCRPPEPSDLTPADHRGRRRSTKP